MSNFAYLHLHTHYSSRGAPCAPAEWCRRAVELGYEAMGFTDRSPLAGFPSIFRAAKESTVTPLYGLELDLLLPASAGGRKSEPLYQPALLFARGSHGAQSLSKLAAEAYSGWPGVERALAWESVAANAPGLLLVLLGGDESGALSPCVASAKKLAGWARLVKSAFPEAAFVGLPHSGRPGDNVLCGTVATAAADLGLPIVATPTARYLRPDDAPAYEALKIARKRAGWPRDGDTATSTISTSSVAPDRPGHDYLRSPEEGAALYTEWPEAIENVTRIVEMCKPDPARWPFDAEPSPEAGTYLRDLAQKGLLGKLAIDTLPADISERLDNEVDITQRQHGAWATLTALVHARDGGTAAHPTGAPFGTASGSLLSYALGISPTNPLGNAHPAPLTSGTDSPLPLPSIELPANRRDEIMAALSGEFGPGRITHTACPLPILPIQAVQAAASVLGISGGDLKSSALAAIERGWDALSTDEGTAAAISRLGALALALKDVPLTFTPDLDTFITAPRQTHGTATLSTYGPLLTTASLTWLPWTEEEITVLGYPAFKSHFTQPLAAIDTAITLARRYPVPGLQADALGLSSLPSLAEAASDIIRKGELAGIPYLSPTAAKSWSGEADLDTAAQMVARSLYPARPQPPDPKPGTWDDTTASTGGALLFKDQLVALLGSLGMQDLDIKGTLSALLRNSDPASEAARERFILTSDLDADAADTLWKSLSEHARTLITRDAAAAWGRTALWLIAIKSAHPAAFIAGSLATTTERAAIKLLAEEARRLGVRIGPPDINRSEAGHLLSRDGEGWAIVWGLDHLPGWQPATTKRFLAARPAAGFTSLREVALAGIDAGLSMTHLQTLIQSGACDALGTVGAPVRDREAMLAVLPAMLEWAKATRRSAGQLDLFAAGDLTPPVEEDLEGLPQSPRLRHMHRLWEEANIGLAFTQVADIDNLLAALERSGDLRSHLLTTAQITEQHLGTSISLVGILCSIQTLQSAIPGEEDPIAAGRLEDAHGSIEIIAFPLNYRRHDALWTESNLIIVTARVLQHEDGELYLLSEHIAPFQAGTGEEAMTLTIKAARSSKSSALHDGKTAAPPTPGHISTPPAVPVPVGPGGIQAEPLPARKQSAASTEEAATYSLIISIPPAAHDHEVIDSMIALNGLLNSHPGPDSVTVRVEYSPETRSWTSARLPRGVRFSQSLELAIRRLLGDDALAVIKLIG